MNLKFPLGLLVLVVLLPNTSQADEACPMISNFHAVTPSPIYRGAAPGSDGLDCLTGLKVHNDIDLEHTRFWVIDPEKEKAQELGMEFIPKPMLSLPGVLGDFTQISDEEVNSILAILANAKNEPTFVHCQKGMDRTGLIIGLHRVINEKVKPEDAWAEMLKYGYHPHFTGLTHYFEKRTGWKAPDSESEEL